ncbi:MAG: cupin domain-containing protein [Acidobacteria bacterium]|nr:cupin domain-containing protein [Acidobacteriota bacterium]
MLVLEATFQRGSEPVPHLHREENEAYYMLEGEIDFHVGDSTTHATPGTFVLLPKDQPHSFRLKTDQAKALLVCWPCGIESFIEEFSEPATAQVLPPLPDYTRFNFRHFAERSASYGIELVIGR